MSRHSAAALRPLASLFHPGDDDSSAPSRAARSLGLVGGPTGSRACNDRLVLVVDDDREIRSALAEVLEDSEYEVLQAANGLEALEHLGRCELPPFLILLDVMMPKMNGWEFRREQLTRPALAAIPVVVIS